MTDPKPSSVAQISLGALFSNPLLVGVFALLCILLSAFVPVATVTGRIFGFGASGGMGLPALVGWAYALPLLGFAAHLATIRIPAAKPYRRVACIAALACWSIVVLAGVVEVINILDNAQQLGISGRGGMSPPNNPLAVLAPSVSVSPHLGIVLLLLAPLALWRANSLATR